MNPGMLAIRNLLRNRRRSLTTLVAMCVGLTSILVFGGYASNVIYGLQTAVVKRSGHLQIQRQGFFANGGDSPSDYGIARYQALIDRIRSDEVLGPMLAVVTPTLQFGGLAGNSNAGVSRSVYVDGVVADERNAMFNWNDYGVRNYTDPLALVGTSRDSVILGAGVALKLRLCGPPPKLACPIEAIGADQAEKPPQQASGADPASDLPADIAGLSALEAGAARKVEPGLVEVLTATSRGAPNVASLRVAAVTNVGIKEWDDVYLVMHLQEAQRLVYGDQEPQVSAIMLQLKHTSQLAAARERLQAMLTEMHYADRLEILDYETLNPLYGQSVSFMLSVFTFMAALIGTIVLFTVSNTMTMAVAERTVEVGTLRAIGLNRDGVRNLFVWEGAMLGVAGGIVGTCVALLAATIINHSGLTWTPPGHVFAYFVHIGILDDPLLLAGSIVVVLLVAVCSAWWPARRAARMEVVEALRHI